MTLNTRRRRDRRKARFKRVFLNDVDVTRDCFYADGRRGVVRLYARDATGQYYVAANGLEIANEERRGHVRWVDTR